MQCENGIGLPRADLRAQPFSRTLLVHNDAARVAEMSAARWPEVISSLITVPVVKAGTTQAVIEVANARGRRATEWEPALISGVSRHESPGWLEMRSPRMPAPSHEPLKNFSAPRMLVVPKPLTAD